MKALTLHAEWLPLILEAATDPRFKTIENRIWRPPDFIAGQYLALHAGKFPGPAERLDRLEYIQETCRTSGLCSADFLPVLSRAVESAIVAVVRVAGYWVMNSEGVALYAGAGKPVQHCGADRPRWWFPDQYGWALENIRPLPVPVPCRGAQKLWNLPADVERQVREQIGAIP